MSTFPTALDTFKSVSANPYMDDGAALATEVIAELQSAITALQLAVGTTDYAQAGSLMARVIENLGLPYNILMRNADGDVEGISTVAFNPVTFALETLILATSAVRALSEVTPLALQVGESGTFRELTLSPGAAAPEYNDGAATQKILHTGNVLPRDLISGAARTLYNNVRTRSADTSVLSSLPTITALSGLISSVHPVTWEVNPSSDACVFAYSGGSTAIFLGASDGVWFPSTTYNVNTGQADHYWRAETECDGSGIAFGVTAWSGSGPRIIIDGVYYSLDGAVNGTGVGAGAGTIYFMVPFAEAKKRRIILEGRYDIKLVSVHTSNNAACTKPADSASAKMVFVGDSNAAMYGYDTKGDSYALVMADCLGIRNTHLTAVSGTGFKAVNGGSNYSYVERVADVTGSVGTDIVIAAMSWNDVGYGFTPAEVAAAAVTFLDAVRTAHPAAAIIVHGVITWNVSGGDETLIDAQETAVAAAISGIGDALIGFIPVRTSAAAPILFGDSTVVGTHANKYVNNGIDHMTPLGNNYVGRWLADRVFEKLAEMLGAEAPAILPPPPPTSASSSGISTGAAIALRTVRF